MIPVALIPYLYQAVTGIAQSEDSKDELKNLKRPTYKTPSEVTQALTLSKREFSDPRFAGQAQLEAQVQQNASQALETAQRRGSGMQNVAGIVAANNQAAQDIGAEAARQQRGDLQDYQNMLQLMAGYKDKEFQMNKFAPYSDKYNEAREMKGAGQQNTFQALDALSAIAGRMMSPEGQTSPVDAATQSASSQQFTKTNDFADEVLAKQMRQWALQSNYYKNALYSAAK